MTASDTFIVMELLSGGELFNRIVEQGRFTEEAAANLFAQILLSMEYLHSLDIVHRDVKPENILYVSEGAAQIKLIDFGYAGVWAPDKQLTGLCGTPDYVAPEVLTWYDDDESGTPYGKGSDLWSLGVLLYVILSGCSPFSADEEEAILEVLACRLAPCLGSVVWAHRHGRVCMNGPCVGVEMGVSSGSGHVSCA